MLNLYFLTFCELVQQDDVLHFLTLLSPEAVINYVRLEEAQMMKKNDRSHMPVHHFEQYQNEEAREDEEEEEVHEEEDDDEEEEEEEDEDPSWRKFFFLIVSYFHVFTHVTESSNQV